GRLGHTRGRSVRRDPGHPEMMFAAALIDLAAKTPKGGEGVKSGPIGLAVILVLCIAAYFLFKSMSKHLRKVREEFPGQEPTDTTDQRGESDSAGAPTPDVP